jgi:hypothetical protein
MYMICWSDNGQNKWEIVEGVSAMQQKILELEKLLQCDASDIFVFDTDTEID